ncbi:MAG: Mov34/MPN/PAD-1 family protein [Pirellulaceae bacterium]|nr:Mov34/MPN/PAD-1 family protein [Pirellulaceae bacterium]
MSDQEIQFGEVEETKRLPRLRPDRNKQLTVVACGSPAPQDLPIFVDLDAMRDMENHARSDTRVELGGVLLGGQYEDESGQPYVVIQDTLRARHYESSKGSFKFTHDTWADFTSRRDEFPAELQMVGWYHTHPDWGVFLSGMDMFICDHFFNRPLDVALVIDPCRGERGWFQWTGDPGQRVRETAGFYLIASRHRQSELEHFAAQIEGKFSMAHDVYSAGSGQPTAFPVSVTNVPDPRSGWLALGVMGTLTVQLLVLMLFAWKLLFATPDTLAPAGARRPSAATESPAASGELTEYQRQTQQVESQLHLLDRVIEALDDEAPKNLVLLLENQRREIEQLHADVRAYRALESRSNDEIRTLGRKLDEAAKVESKLRSQVHTLDQALASVKSREREFEERIDELQDELKLATAASDDDRGVSSAIWSASWWIWVGAAALVLAMLFAGYAWSVRRTPPIGESSDSESDAPTSSSDDIS